MEELIMWLVNFLAGHEGAINFAINLHFFTEIVGIIIAIVSFGVAIFTIIYNLYY